jgi:hypothetical protein
MVASLLSSLAQMEFIKCLHRPSGENLSGKNDREYEIRTIIRAKIHSAFLSEFKTRLENLKGEADA